MFSFNLEKINALAKSICEEFATGFPPEMQAEESPRAKRKLASALNGVDQSVSRFLATKPRIGVFQKAKCANEIKWDLKKRGYQQDLVAAVVRNVVFGLSLKSRK